MLKLPRLVKWTGSVVLLFLLLLTLFRFVFYFAYRPADAGFPADAFLMGLRLDLRVVSILGLVMLILCIVPYLNPFRRASAAQFWTVLLTLLFTLLVLVYVTDFFHYEYLRQRLNASIMNYLADAGISMNMVWESYPVIRALLLIVVLVLVTGYLFRRILRAYQAQEKPVRAWRWPWVLGLALVFIAGTWGTLGQFALRWSDVFSLGDSFRAQLALNPVQSFFSTLSFKNSSYDTRKAMAGYRLMSSYLGLPEADSARLNYERYVTPAGPIARGTRPNIILVICESFSAYKSSMWGNPLDPTPYFDSLCRDGVFFDRCFTPSYGTARGVWATITGIPDVEHPRTASRNPALVDQNTIINDFVGYEKFYFLGGSASWANIRGLLQYNINGLHLYEQQDYEAEQIDVWGVSDKNLLLAADEVLAKQQKPFFAIIQTADNHRPYTIPSEDLDEFRKVNVHEDTLKKYGYISIEELNAFRYTDFGYRKFMEAARKRPYFRNTVFVFVGDHGIRGDAGSMFPKAWTEQALTTVHVPLLFYAPGLLEPSRNSSVCSQMDILPSLAGLLSMPYRNTGLGRDLFDTTLHRNPFRFSSAFIVDPDEKKIGVVSDSFYLRKHVGRQDYEFVSLFHNDALPPGPRYDSLKYVLGLYSEAFYETARYMLYNNKKPKKTGQPATGTVRR